MPGRGLRALVTLDDVFDSLARHGFPAGQFDFDRAWHFFAETHAISGFGICRRCTKPTGERASGCRSECLLSNRLAAFFVVLISLKVAIQFSGAGVEGFGRRRETVPGTDRNRFGRMLRSRGRSLCRRGASQEARNGGYRHGHPETTKPVHHRSPRIPNRKPPTSITSRPPFSPVKAILAFSRCLWKPLAKRGSGVDPTGRGHCIPPCVTVS